MYKTNLVSVIVPVYNRADLIGSTIRSILAQTYSSFEIIIINDGSTDDTLDVLNKFVQEHPEKITILNQNNSGQVTARNNGIKNAGGEYIAFLDSDDTWLPHKLEKQMPLFRQGVGLVYSGINEVDESGRILRTVPCEKDMRGDIYRQLLIKNRMTGGSVVVKRDAIEKVGIFDPSLKAAENWDLWIRISKEFSVDYVDEPLVNYLKHEGNMSADSPVMLNATKCILQKHLLDVPSDPLLEGTYKKAYANYYYRYGIYYYSRGQYHEARREFRKSLSFCANNMDIYIRIFRSYLGKNINRFFSRMKKSWLGYVNGQESDK